MKTSTLSGTFSKYKDDFLTSQCWLKVGQSTSVPYDRREECQLWMDRWVGIGYSPGKDQRLGTTDDAASIKTLKVISDVCFASS